MASLAIRQKMDLKNPLKVSHEILSLGADVIAAGHPFKHISCFSQSDFFLHIGL